MKLTHLACVALLALSLSVVPRGLAENFTKGTKKNPYSPLKAGDYVWTPAVAPAGPVVIIASLPEQTLYVYRNGIRIGRSSISSGKAGHRTPTGVFTILEKNVKHTSTIYKGASMPYMERLTWGGVAMHAGNLPGYPASHGCVRLPLDFAEKLYTVTTKGTTVIVTDGKAVNSITAKPGLLLSGAAVDAPPDLTGGRFTWTPDKSPTGPVSILFSSADREAYVFRNGVEIGRASISGSEGAKGSYAYSALSAVNPDGSHDWQALGSADDTKAPNLKALAKHLVIPPDFLKLARGIVAPGSTLVITDRPINGDTHSGPGFSILTADASKTGE